MDSKKFSFFADRFSPFILGICIVMSTIIGSFTFYKVRSFDNALSVTGSARKEITSDQVKWVTMISRQVSESSLKSGYAQMDSDLRLVKKFFKDQGVSEDVLTISPVFMDQMYRGDYSVERDYTLRQTIELNSKDITRITAIAKNTGSLVGQGVVFATQSLEYSYSKLPELRVTLLADALRDAKARASTLAETTGKKIGKLKSAASGVVQVLPVNSVDVSDYGAYDMSNIQKVVMVTVKAAFSLK
jgi:hypothetical protein